MNNIIQFIKDFNSNKGGYVFLSFVIEKLIGLFNAIYLVRLISKEDFGLITLISSLFAVTITLNGFGAIQALLRYGSIADGENNKNNLTQYLFRNGIKKHILLTICFLLIAVCYEIKFEGIWPIALWFTVRFLGYFFYTFILNYYRIHHHNKKFSSISIFVNCIGSLITLLLTLKLNTSGYLIGLAFTPWLSLIFYKKNIFEKSGLKRNTIDLKELWDYAIKSAINYGLAEILIVLDIFLIGLFLSETEVANYKIAIILPMNIIFLSSVFIQTDFPKLVSKSNDKIYLKNYIRSYQQLFIPIGIIFLIVGYLIKDWIISFVFGNSYEDVGNLFFIILIAVISNMLMRNLYSNLLSAVGLAKQNTKIAIFSILVMALLSLSLIPLLGIIGAALALSITFISTGIFSLILFKKYLKSL